MIDSRWEQLAGILVHHSTRVGHGDRVLITVMEANALPLAQAVHAEVVRAGGLPHAEFQSASLERDLLVHGDASQSGWVPELQKAGMEWADVYIGLRGTSNSHMLDGVDPSRIAARRQALGVISTIRTNTTRWVLVRIPDEAFAEQAAMTYDGMMGFFFRAVLRDWEAERARYEALQRLFAGGNRVEIEGTGTKLAFSTKGRIYEIDDGRVNMPGGEILTSPVEDSADGEISFEQPGTYAGRRIPGIRLTFREGDIVRASAVDNQALLDRLLDMDAGSRRIGEFGVGTNPGIDRFCGDIFFDEKIYGTVHIALGRSYPSCGGRNESALHWDIVKDLRSEGLVRVDGRVVLEQGRFIGV